MKNCTVLMMAALAALGASAGEVGMTYGMQLDVPDAGTSFHAAAITRTWNQMRAGGRVKRDANGNYPFTIYMDKRDPQAAKFAGLAEIVQRNDSLHVRYSLTPDRDVDLAQLCLTGSFELDVYGGGTVTADGRTVKIPATHGKTHFFDGWHRVVSLADAQGRTRLTFTFDAPTHLMMQDNRAWNGNSTTMRIFLGADKPFKGGRTYTTSFTLSGSEALSFNDRMGEVKITAGADWVPLVTEPEIEPGSALDFSTLRGTEAPAGKYGRVVAKGQNFEFEKLPGVTQRFYGVNICGDANTPDYETARKFARRLAMIGYNALRFHHHESCLVQRKDGTSLDPEAMKRFDGLVAACVENGLYMTTDLFVSRRPITYRALGIDLDGVVDMSEFKELVQAHEGAFANYLQFARAFLGHVNPYTGRSLAEEPAMGWLSFVNEGNLGNGGMKWMLKHPCFREKWQAWLAAKKSAEPSAYANVPDTLPQSLDARTSPHVQAYTLFLQDLETKFAARVTKFLREEMKCRALTTNMNNWHYPAVYQLPRAKSYDYVDDHFYVDHPRFLEQRWALSSRCPNRNPMLGADMGAQGLTIRRVLDRPFTITEYNYSGPGRFRGVGGIACGTAAALQNWAGLWRFAWSHGQQGVAHPETKTLNYFDMSGDPLGLASERASICLFLRRDLEPLARTYAIVLPERKLGAMGESPWLRTSWTWASWYAKTGNIVADAAPADATWSVVYPDGLAKTSDEVRREILPDASPDASPVAGDGAVTIDPKSGSFILRTPRTCGGFAERGVVAADALTVDLGGTAATVWASALDAQPLRASSHILLTHLTDVQNSDIIYADHDLTILLEWGHLPHLMRAGTAQMRLAVADGRWTVHVLSTSGHRRATIPCTVENGTLSFTANVARDAANASYLYELVRE